MNTLELFATGPAATPHYGIRDAGSTHTICGTDTNTRINETDRRMCQQCERGRLVLLSHIVRPEIRTAAGAKGSAAGHLLIAGHTIGYCGKQLGDNTPGHSRVCKNCAELCNKVAAFAFRVLTDRLGYEPEAARPVDCPDCDWIGRTDAAAPAAHAEWESHHVECPGNPLVQAETEQDTAAAELVDTVTAVEQAEAADGTWRGGWITSTPAPTGALFELAPTDAEQGALFA